MNTPGFGGYLRAILISLVTFAGGAITIALMSAEQKSDLDPAGFLWVVVATAVVGTPVAAIGALLVHLLCSHEPRQWVHVCAAGAAGVVVPVLAVLLLSGGAFQDAPFIALFTLPIALAAMVGRVAVIPLVTARREQLASAASVRVP